MILSFTFIALELPFSNDMAVNQLIATNLATIATVKNEPSGKSFYQ